MQGGVGGGTEPRTRSASPGWRGAAGEGIDSAGKVKPVSSQPTTFSLQSLGHLFWETMWVLLSARTEAAKKGEKKNPGLSCSESCTSRDHLSALIESQGCSAGGDARPDGPDKHTYVYDSKVNLGGLSRPLRQRRRAPAERKDVGFRVTGRLQDSRSSP